MDSKEVNNKVKSYFVAVEGDGNKCTICARAIAGAVCNMKDHLWSKHNDIAKTIGVQEKKKRPRDESVPSTSKKRSIMVDINATTKECIKLVLKNNLSLRVADHLGHTNLLGEQFKAFNMTMNRQVFKSLLMESATKTYQLISEEIKDILPSIMFDSASRFGRNVFGVSLRYIKDGRLMDRTIGMLTQNDRQTASVLADQLIELLRRVNKTVDDIYSTCSDQGRNVVKAADLLIRAQNHILVNTAILDNETDYSDITNEIMHENEEAQFVPSGENIDVLEESLGPLCSKFYCGAHVLQLAAKDVTKHFDPQLKEIRDFVHEAKKVCHTRIFQKPLRRPPSDIAPRWDSTYIMIEVFYEMEEIYTEKLMEPLVLHETAWDFIHEYKEAFEPVHLAMKDFQRADYTISDFYLRWLRLEVQLKKIQLKGSNDIVDKLIEAISRRGAVFVRSGAFAAALLLDPRFAWSQDHPVLNYDLQKLGINTIMKIHHKIGLQSNAPSVQESEVLEADDDEIFLTQLLGGTSRLSQARPETSDMKSKVINFSLTEPRVRPNQNFSIIDYWRSKRDDAKWKDLYRVAMLVYGAPFSQVKCERDFSAFAIAYTHLRTLLSDDTLNAIFIVRNNLDLLDHVTFY